MAHFFILKLCCTLGIARQVLSLIRVIVTTVERNVLLPRVFGSLWQVCVANLLFGVKSCVADNESFDTFLFRVKNS